MTHREAMAGPRKVLVSRLTGKVSYYWADGGWIKPTDAIRSTLQGLYEGQKAAR
ncbi:MAG: hypothetical protein ABH875_01585 [Candidatus Omnitrophota bacterium]